MVRKTLAAGLFAGLMALPAFAQTPAPVPGWAIGRPEGSTLAPHAPRLTATPLEQVPVQQIRLPQGFRAEVFAHGMPGVRAIAEGPNGTLFAGTRAIGRVYAITRNADGTTRTRTLLTGLAQPNGLVMIGNSLYVFAVNRVLRYDNIEDKLDNPGTPVDLTAAFGLPPEVHHNWKYAAFGPDGKLYIQVGANCNICEINPGIHAQIRRYNPDGTGMEIVARGVRNTVGFDWHPVTKELWFTDNGRDWAGDAGPDDELNRIAKGNEGANFGFPYCHANGIPDRDVKKPNPCAGVTMPAALLGPHAGALGIKFYTGKMFPASYKNVAFIARRGSWNREKKFGYDVVMARVRANGTAEIRPFMTGLLDTKENTFAGRPTYVLQMPDGALLVSDEQNGATYRISYGKQRVAAN